MTEQETKAKRLSFLQKRSPCAARAALLACSLCLAGIGCGSGSAESTDAPAPASGPAAEVTAGSVNLSLDVGNAHLDGVQYTVVGGSFHKSGSLDVSNSTRISGVIGGIPFGTDYVVTLSAASSVPVATTCEGSAAFQVPDDVQVQVAVHVTCNQQKLATATPAPIPPADTAVLSLVLLGVGLAFQRKASLGTQGRAS